MPTTLLESSFAGFGDAGTAPINLGDSANKRISIDGDMNTAVRNSNHNEVCGADRISQIAVIGRTFALRFHAYARRGVTLASSSARSPPSGSA